MRPDVEEIIRLCRRMVEDFEIDCPLNEEALVAVVEEARGIAANESQAPAAIFIAVARRPGELRDWCSILLDHLPRYVGHLLGLKLVAKGGSAVAQCLGQHVGLRARTSMHRRPPNHGAGLCPGRRPVENRAGARPCMPPTTTRRSWTVARTARTGLFSARAILCPMGWTPAYDDRAGDDLESEPTCGPHRRDDHGCTASC